MTPSRTSNSDRVAELVARGAALHNDFERHEVAAKRALRKLRPIQSELFVLTGDARVGSTRITHGRHCTCGAEIV